MQHEPAPLTRHLRIHRHRDHTVLEFHGDIDIATALEISPFLDTVTARAAPQIVVDLRPVEFFDCSGLRLLDRARRRAVARGGSLLLVCTHPLTLRILHVTGLVHLMPPYTSVDEATSQPETTSGSA
ncbi:anti-sigma factor antagonist [Streptomyces sp. NPDC059785]|uniref:anti-sigma factor antagonist n=1 Tax=unclassified Streptomyces TaxID=2593676 RepID=UPI0036609A56